jgi:hypothetical protein
VERVAFLIEETNLRLPCMLNPESLVFRRQSGVSLPDQTAGRLAAGGTERVVFTGGGFTELELDLVFDVSLASGGSILSRDVRDHTAPIWELGNSHAGRQQAAPQAPFLRFVWGKTWNVRTLVRALAERLENFDSVGRPGRSWLRLRLLQVPEPAAESAGDAAAAWRTLDHKAVKPSVDTAAEARTHVTAPGIDGGTVSTDRLDRLAERYYGNAALWRPIAQANNIDHPDRLAAGIALVIPALAAG